MDKKPLFLSRNAELYLWQDSIGYCLNTYGCRLKTQISHLPEDFVIHTLEGAYINKLGVQRLLNSMHSVNPKSIPYILRIFDAPDKPLPKINRIKRKPRGLWVRATDLVDNMHIEHINSAVRGLRDKRNRTKYNNWWYVTDAGAQIIQAKFGSTKPYTLTYL